MSAYSRQFKMQERKQRTEIRRQEPEIRYAPSVLEVWGRSLYSLWGI